MLSCNIIMLISISYVLQFELLISWYIIARLNNHESHSNITLRHHFLYLLIKFKIKNSF